MEHRLGRTLRVFFVALAAAGFYRLTVVPLIEPRIRDATAGIQMSPEEAAAIRARADQRLAALAEAFPPGSWERDNPIMLESRQMRLLFKDYHSLPDGRVNLVPCTLVVLPDRNRAAATAAGGRTIVMRAPQGAVLEFDEPLDLRQGRLAKLVGGNLRGQITIRGTPTAPGGEDDIEIVTRDITLDEFEVRTGEMVQFRYGRSSGSGRGFVARLSPREAKTEHGPNFGGVDSLRLDRDVRMRLEGLAGGLVPGRQSTAATPAAAGVAADVAPAVPPPPVLVSCRGSLCLNMSANVITLEEQVDVLRAGADAASDHLTCDLLAILLARREQAGGLEPVEIQAKGAPVVATSTGVSLEARAARLGYEIATRRILLDGEEPVTLAVQGTSMEARKIDYTPGPPGDPGRLMAVGPGWLQARAERAPPAQVRWQQWLRMRPDGENHVVSIAGAAEVAVEGQGRLAAAEMHLWLDVAKGEIQAAAPRTQTNATAAGGLDMARVRPARLLARGTVEVDAEQADVRTERLELWFRHVQPAAPAAPPAPAAVAAATPPPAVPAATVPTPITPPPATAPTVKEPPANRLAATAALVRGLVVLAPAGNELEELSMEGQVRLVELPADSGLEIDGDQVQLARATRFDARAVVSGRPARVRGRDMNLEGPLLEFDRGRGRITIDGAGRLSVPLANGGVEALGLGGPPAPRPVVAAAAPPRPLDVTWQGRMDFDGLTARFTDRVVATGAEATLRAGSLDVIFDRPFDFANATPQRRPEAAAGGNPQPQVARIACGSGVQLESETATDGGGRSRERLFARDLVLDRVSGDVSGSGPGRLTSIRTGGGPVALGPSIQPVSAPVVPPQGRDGLTYLGVDFQRGLRGNLHRRSMEFQQRVEAIWGPVGGWDGTLDPHATGGLPAGVFTVSCETLGVGQTPPLPGQPRAGLELGAAGNVLVEGESFTARSARLSWSEAKDLLVFEGDGRADAQLFRQLQAGGQPSSASAGKILYWRGLNRVEVEDARFLDLDQLRGGGGSLPRP
jgi:hypothetical protein